MALSPLQLPIALLVILCDRVRCKLDDLPPLPEALQSLKDAGRHPSDADEKPAAKKNKSGWTAPWDYVDVSTDSSASKKPNNPPRMEDPPRPPRQQDPPPPPPGPVFADSSADIRVKAALTEERKVPAPADCRAPRKDDVAIVTLISSNEGYPAGALAISAALEVLESELRRIVLVTHNVNAGIRELLRTAAWEVREISEVKCRHILGPTVTPDKYDLGGEYRAKMAKWTSTCSKFWVWNLTFLRKVVFLDADAFPVKPVDSLVEHPSAFAAAPDTFPADQFNSGVMVIEPDAKIFEDLLAWNMKNGSAEGGDQCLLNEFFEEWYYSAWDNAATGRLPWIFNVAAAHFPAYKTLTRMQSRDEPTVVHFVGGESKPWGFMVYKYQGLAEQIPPANRRLLDVWDDMYWLAKTNRVCAGTLRAEDKAEGRRLLDSV